MNTKCRVDTCQLLIRTYKILKGLLLEQILISAHLNMEFLFNTILKTYENNLKSLKEEVMK